MQAKPTLAVYNMNICSVLILMAGVFTYFHLTGKKIDNW